MNPALVLFCLTILFVAIQQARPRFAGHDLTFLLFNLAFAACLMPVAAMAWLAVFLLSGYGLAAGARRWKRVSIALFSGPVIVMFAVFKKYEILPLQPLYVFIPEILGLSYIVFRVLMVLFEARDSGRLPRPLPYLNFCLSMFTILSGPIQRPRAFAEDLERRKDFRLDETTGAAALTRFMNGAIKVIFCAGAAQNMQNYFMAARVKSVSAMVVGNEIVLQHSPLIFAGPLASSLGFGIAALFFLLYLYFNFSGYTDMMIGLGRMVGFNLPENFDNPFVAASFLDFWKRWHISLSLWFRDYCFTPVLKRIIKAGVKNQTLATLPAYFISFGLLGLWHGRSWPFLLCGLMFAVGSVVNQFYRSLLRGRAVAAKLNANPVYQAFCSALTFFYIALAITDLWLSGDEIVKIWHSSTTLSVVSFALIVLMLTGIVYFMRKIWITETMRRIIIAPVQYFLADQSPFMIATKMFLVVIWYFSFSTNMPDFVYQKF